MKTPLLLSALLLAPLAAAQVKTDARDVAVSVKAIAAFRGATVNQIMGVGLVMGLAGTGDSKKFLQTQKAVVNLLRAAGLEVDPTASETKNVALVAITAKLPAYPRPGGRFDVTVSAIGDCTSLRGGNLYFANLHAPGSAETVATVDGGVSVGGFTVGAGGNSAAKGFSTVGTMPGAGIITKGMVMKTLFDGKMYLDLMDADPTTAQRVEEAINRKNPAFHAHAYDASTVEIDLPAGMAENLAQSTILETSVLAPSEAKIVIDERTGTIVIGGDVRVGPCVVAQGGLTIKVTDTPFVSQPAPLSKGETVKGSVKTLDVNESTAEFAAIRANTSIADLAAMFHALRLKASDIATILGAMRAQGALKARVEVR